MTMRWISVNERLPEEIAENDTYSTNSAEVLIVDGGRIHVGHCRRNYDDYDDRTNLTLTQWVLQGRDGYFVDNVTHWQPLPELP